MPISDLDQVIHGRVVLVGIGNEQRGDDGAGPRVVRQLEGLVARNGTSATLVGALDAGVLPETNCGWIASHSPDVVLLVDAVHMEGAEPGDVALLHAGVPDDLPAWGTHRPPLALFMQQLGERTGAHVLLIGIQPERVDWGTRPSAVVRGSILRLVKELRRIFTEGTVP